MIDVKLIRIITGEEIIAELLEETDTSIKVQNGLVVLPNPQGVGFAPWATVISKENPEITVQRHTLCILRSSKKMFLQNTMKCLGVN